MDGSQMFFKTGDKFVNERQPSRHPIAIRFETLYPRFFFIPPAGGT